MENVTEAKLAQIASLLGQYQERHLEILLTLARFQCLHNRDINESGLPTSNERYQVGIEFFNELMEITTR